MKKRGILALVVIAGLVIFTFCKVNNLGATNSSSMENIEEDFAKEGEPVESSAES